jgi:hypothetical protein
VFLDGERLRYRIPVDDPEARQLLAEIRQNRAAVIAMLRDAETRPPALEEATAMLPAGLRVLRYEPKAVPFAVAPVSVVTNARTFFRRYLKDLAWRLAHPDTYAAPPLADILTKLADAGLDLIREADLLFCRRG